MAEENEILIDNNEEDSDDQIEALELMGRDLINAGFSSGDKSIEFEMNDKTFISTLSVREKIET